MFAQLIPQAILHYLMLPVMILDSILVGWLVLGRRAGATHESLDERAIQYWLSGVTVISWVGVILASIGLFRWWVFALLLAVLVGYRVYKWRRQSQHEESAPAAPRTPLGAQIALAVLLVVAGWLYNRPVDGYYIDGDPGVYAVGGIWLAQEGTLWAHSDPFWAPWQAIQETPESANLPSEIRIVLPSIFSRQFNYLETTSTVNRFPGPFYQWHLGTQQIEIGFLPLPKVWIGLSAVLFGSRNGTYATPFMALTALVALYAVSKRLFGWLPGLFGAALLMISFPQLWFARLSASEIYAQALLLSGIYFAVTARQSKNTLQLYLSAWACAAMMVLRFEGIIFLALLVPLMLLAWHRDNALDAALRRRWLAVLLAGTVLGGVISLGHARYYIFTRSLLAIMPRTAQLLVVAVLLLLGAAALVYRYHARWCDRIRSLWLGIYQRIPLVLAGVWLLWALGAFIRLVIDPTMGHFIGWLASYWTPTGLLFGVAGAIWLLWCEQRKRTTSEVVPLLAMAIAFMIIYALNSRVTPTHPWASRRLVLIILPVLAVSTAVFLGSLVGRAFDRSRWRVGRPLAVSILAALFLLVTPLQVGAIAMRSQPIWRHAERHGLADQMQAFAETLPKGAVVLLDNGFSARGLAPAFELFFGYPTVIIQTGLSGSVDAALLDQIVRAAQQEQRSVYLITTNGNLQWFPPEWRFISQGITMLDVPVLREVWGALPTASDVTRMRIALDVYRLEPASPSEQAQLPLAAPMGAGGYGYLRAGFYSTEANEQGNPFRWTGAQSRVVLPKPSEDEAAGGLCLRARLHAGRPENEAPAELRVAIDGQQVVTQVLERDFAPQNLAIPFELAQSSSQELIIDLVVNTWNATSYSNGADGRDLGIALYSLEVSADPGCNMPR